MNQQEIEIIKEHQNEYVESRIKDILYEVETLKAIKDDLQKKHFNGNLDKFEIDALKTSLTTLKQYVNATEDIVKVLEGNN